MIGTTQTLFVALLLCIFIIGCGNTSEKNSSEPSTTSSTSGSPSPAITTNIEDRTPPVITIIGANPLILQQGSTYIDEGANAIDEIDGIISVNHISDVNPNDVGLYTITYSATDSSGNTAMAIRTVSVTPNNPPTLITEPTNSIASPSDTTNNCNGFQRELDTGPLVSSNICGLQYRRHAAIGESNPINIVPDFSFAGFKAGGVSIPSIAAHITLSPLENEDDTQQIQDAIDTVSQLQPNQNGYRGAILLSAGEYDISSTLNINTSGVILRGAGQHPHATGGTVLRAKSSIRDQFIHFKGERNFSLDSSTRVNIISNYVAIGSTNIEVDSTDNFSIGDTVGITRTPNEEWLKATGMDSIISNGSNKSWNASSYSITHIRTIKSIYENTIIIDIPVVDSIQQSLGGGYVAKADTNRRIHTCGIEDIRLISDFISDEDEDHAWDAIKIENAENCWVRRVTTKHFAFSAVNIVNSSFNTIEEVANLDMKSEARGGRRYPFNVDGASVGNLFHRCYSSTGRHNFVTGSRVTGPNVWLDCLAENSLSDDGPHHRWATGSLYDNIETLQLVVQNRYDSGSGHGWAGAQIAFWNSNITSNSINVADAKPSRIIIDAAPTSINWAVGVIADTSIGTSTRIANQPQGIIEFFGNRSQLRSLYLAQLEDRLGVEAIENVTIPAQRSGRIWDALRAWKGEGLLSNFIEN